MKPKRPDAVDRFLCGVCGIKLTCYKAGWNKPACSVTRVKELRRRLLRLIRNYKRGK